MGCCKQLLPINGEPAITYCINAIIEAGIRDIVVVVGHHRRAVLHALEGLPIDIVMNHNKESQMAYSVKLGLTAMPQAISGILVALCDHPLVRAETYLLLRRMHELYPDNILLPTCRGRDGHPPLFPRALCHQVDSGKPMNRIIADHKTLVRRLEVNDPGIVYDMDYQADYRRLLALASEQTAKSFHRGTR